MAKMLKWVDFMNRLPGAPSDRAIAKAAGVSPSAVTRWRSGQDPKPTQAAQLARAYGLHPINGLVAAGFMTLDDVDAIFEGQQKVEIITLDQISTVDLIEEAARRLRLEAKSA